MIRSIGKRAYSSGLLIIVILMALTLTGCTFTQKTTVENKDGQEVRRTSYGVEFHGLLGDDSDDD
ncbi:MAG: hypothetical protein CBC13_00415 [Planctomycetia bacterium TMED53]|nr:MAG: hypothetical protein CBC13_00415 [Planctomycetia bacterium TMED53]